MKLKTCPMCGEAKPKTEFYRDRRALRPRWGGDGLDRLCKTCTHARVREANRKRSRAAYVPTKPGAPTGYRHSLERTGSGGGSDA